MGSLVVTEFTNIVNLIGGRASSYVTSGWIEAPSELSTDAALLNGVNIPNTDFLFVNNPTTDPYICGIQLGFNQSSNIFKLDGAAAISFNSLPVGFTITSLVLSIDTDGYADVPNNSATLQIAGQSQNIPVSDGFNTFTLNYNLVPGNPLSALTFINYTLDLNGISHGLILSGFVGLRNLSIIGTYNNVTFTYAIDTPNPINIGHDVSVSSVGPDLGGLDLSATTSIDLTYLDNGSVPHTINIPYSNFTYINPFLLIFVIPIIFRTIWINLGITSRSVTIVANINGTQFSGSITLGTRTILLENVSGIYQIVSGKTSDTVYDRTGTTLEVKIPNPFIKTGYIGT